MQQTPRADWTAQKYESSQEIIDTHGIVLRNYDHEDAHELLVAISNSSGATVYNEMLAVKPLETVTVRPAVEPDTYRVTVEADGEQAASEPCLIGSPDAEAALIELGNGIISLTDGLRETQC